MAALLIDQPDPRSHAKPSAGTDGARSPVGARVAHVLLAILKVAMVAGVISAIPTTISIWSGNGNERLR
jgi:hypothetical protein